MDEKLQKVLTRTKSGKPLNTRSAAVTGVKESKDGKDVLTTSGVSNGTITSESQPKLPFAKSKSKSFNDRSAGPTPTNVSHAKVDADADVKHFYG